MMKRLLKALRMVASVRPSLRRIVTVEYMVPGLLPGVLVLQKRGTVTMADVQAHAVLMKYGAGFVHIKSLNVPTDMQFHVVIKAIR